MPPADNADLLALTCAAHGGLTGWQATSRMDADVAITGSNDQNLWMALGDASQVGAPSRG
jgi:hypothetical protein